MILLASPIKAVYFAIFVLALQQLDGNVIGPKNSGRQNGPFQLVGDFRHLGRRKLFGVVGMFFGVPVCACIYSALEFYVNVRLRKKNLPVETETYTTDTAAASPEDL